MANDITKYVTIDNIVSLLKKLKKSDFFVADKNYVGGFRTGFVKTGMCRPVQIDESQRAYVEIGGNANLGKTSQPIYIKDGEFELCDDMGVVLDEIKKVLDVETINNIKFNKNYTRLEIITGGETNPEKYISTMEKIITPNAPTIAADQKTKIVTINDSTKSTGTVTVTVTGSTTTNADNYYRIQGTNGYPTTWSKGTSISLTHGFTDNGKCKPVTKKVQVRSELNHEPSLEVEHDITIKPKLAAATINASGGGYGKTATITITPSQTDGSTTSYRQKIDGSWSEYKPITTAKSITVINLTNFDNPTTYGANNIEVKVEGPTGEGAGVYEAVDNVLNVAVSAGARHTYYGFSTKEELSGITDIQALAQSGGKLESKGITTGTTYTIYPKKTGDGGYSFVDQKVYIWVCQVNTLTPNKIFDTPDNVINFGFNTAKSIAGWNCYRSENSIPIKDITPNQTIILKS